MYKYFIQLIFLCTIINFCDCEKLKKLSPDFLFGVATSAYQIEGAWDEDGKGLSIWDNFVHLYPNKIKGQANGDVAADSYHHFEDDLSAIIDLQVDFYRFSISWARILPNGDLSDINEPGIQYYNMIIDRLLDNNVEPMITMYHFDTPQVIEDNGGFLNTSIIDKFNAYADVLFKNFGDRVKYWITFNEPYEFCVLSYAVGFMPPLIKNKRKSEYKCMENILKAHAKVYQLYKTKYKQNSGKISMALQSRYFYNDDKDLVNLAMNYQFGIMAQPIYSTSGGYPESVINFLKKVANQKGISKPPLKQLSSEWRELIKGSVDFLALNYYTAANLVPSNRSDFIFVPEGYDMAFDPSWKQSIFTHNHDVPTGLQDVLRWIRENYGAHHEIIITENGWGDKGDLNDIDRITYIEGHLNASLNAINEGSNVTGYTAWSLIDNFEWNHGYDFKFGLYKVDFNDSKLPRIEKESAKFYRNYIENIKSNANYIRNSFIMLLILKTMNCLF